MSPFAALLAELEQEWPSTHQVLERVPGDRLAWRPHPRSTTLGQLALHVATIPSSVGRMASAPGVDLDQVDFTPQAPANAAEILAAHDQDRIAIRALLTAWTAADAETPWVGRSGGQPLFTLPRLGVMRSIGTNHLYHHRGQLTVYLRLLDVPVPSVYGPSADANPFV